MIEESRFYAEKTKGRPLGPFTRVQLVDWAQRQDSTVGIEFLKVIGGMVHPVAVDDLQLRTVSLPLQQDVQNRHIVPQFRVSSTILLGMLCLIVVPALGWWLAGLETLARGWIWFAFGFDLWVLWRQFREDNSRTEIAHPKNRRLLWLASCYWLPILVAIAPGIVVVRTIDSVIDRAIQTMEVWTHAAYQQSESTLNERIADLESRSYRFWWPPDWPRKVFDDITLDALRNVAQHGLPRTQWALRWFGGFVYVLLNATQTISLAFIAFVLLRSFFWIWVRTFLHSGGKLRFRLASFES